MSNPEKSPLITESEQTYHELAMDGLPEDLQRDSRYYYYLSVYPGLKQMEELDQNQLPQLPETVTSAYIHTPYCTGVCNFCSYFLTTVREEDTSPIASYLETVKEEVLQRSQETDLDISYIYFGGGTPSLIPPKALDSFFKFMDKHDVLSPTRFGTLELHPEFFQDLQKAQEFVNTLKANGIGRVSLGFQSSDENVLSETNRRHGTNFLREAIDFLKQNEMMVSLDLIYGLPGLSLNQWERTLEDAVACNPDSIATYFLFVNPGTVMHTQVQRGEITLPPHREIQIQHIMAQKVLEGHGFYELPSDFYARVDGDPSAFTQDSLPSDGASLPLGAGSYGFYDKTQFFNQFSLTKYRERITKGESPIWRGYRFEGQQGAHRDMMFSIKNSPYIDRRLFEAKYGVDPAVMFEDKIDRLVGYGLIEVDDASRRITLTRKGRLCNEEIACQFEIPGLGSNIPADATPSERKKLDKHNFAPLYSILGSAATKGQ
jgi:coproporphyrinogen III oxidase-like Fe-S oxidoreductase